MNKLDEIELVNSARDFAVGQVAKNLGSDSPKDRLRLKKAMESLERILIHESHL